MNQRFVAHFRGKWSSFNRKTSYLSLKSRHNDNYTLILKVWLFCCCCELNPEIYLNRQKGKENPYNILVRKSFLSEGKITSSHITCRLQLLKLEMTF